MMAFYQYARYKDKTPLLSAHLCNRNFYARKESHYIEKYYDDVIMDTMASQIPASPLFTQPFIRVQIKENITAPRHWPLCGEFTGDRWIPRTNGQ